MIRNSTGSANHQLAWFVLPLPAHPRSPSRYDTRHTCEINKTNHLGSRPASLSVSHCRPSWPHHSGLLALVHQLGRPVGQIGSTAANRDLTADPLDGYLRMRMHAEFQILRGWHHHLRHHLRYGLTSPPDAVYLTRLTLPCEVRFRTTSSPSIWLPQPNFPAHVCVRALPFCVTLWLAICDSRCLFGHKGWVDTLNFHFPITSCVVCTSPALSSAAFTLYTQLLILLHGPQVDGLVQ